MGDKNKTDVLVLKGDGLQQFVEAEPIFEAIATVHAQGNLTLLTTDVLGRLAKGAPHFNKVLAYNQGADQATKQYLLNTLKKIGYDVIYDLEGSRLSSEIRRAVSGFRGPKWIGFRHTITRNYISNDEDAAGFIPFAGPAMRKLMAQEGIKVPSRPPTLGWALSSRKDAANMRPSWYGISGQYALLIPARQENARWPAQKYAMLASRLISFGVTPVLIGNSHMRVFGHEVGMHMVQNGPKGGTRALVDLTDKADFAQLAALAKDASFFVSGLNDELHLSLGLGCSGILLTDVGDYVESTLLEGGQIVRMRAGTIATLPADEVVTMLSNMGLLSKTQVLDTAKTREVLADA